ncbi:hypothetical protein D1AOALGA4SA_11808 [Olavius algarvensis Delta 1 endosymbiont]|nr:hypothetical protein D1AOALGA4SA_11808 [Olavius algarvensis Delta 1 endosymbiont]
MISLFLSPNSHFGAVLSFNCQQKAVAGWIAAKLIQVRNCIR